MQLATTGCRSHCLKKRGNKRKPLPWVATGCRRDHMVRRGSTVRVRQRALQKTRTRGAFLDLLHVVRRSPQGQGESACSRRESPHSPGWPRKDESGFASRRWRVRVLTRCKTICARRRLTMQRASRRRMRSPEASLSAVDAKAPRPPRRMPRVERHLRAEVDGSDESDASHEPSYRFSGTTMT